MLAWLKKLFSSKKVEETAPTATPTPAATEAPAENLTGAPEATEEAPSEDMK